MKDKKFVICIDNANYEASLEKWKLYRVVSEESGLLRIIDESGEDYLYESSMFQEISVPQEIAKRYEVSL